MTDNKEVVEWYRKWRPTRFKDVVGQDEAITLLQTMLETNTVPHALLFSGNSGSGKTTLARILRDKMRVSDRDFFEVNCADFRGIDTVREIIRQTKTAAWSGTIKMWLVDEFHRATNDFQEAMLKLLEDTPPHVYFVLATTDPDKLKDTLRTRCTEIKFRALGLTELRQSVELVLGKEKVQLPDSVIDKAIETAGGSARKTLVTLQQVSLLPTEEEQLAAIEPPGLEKGVRDLATALLYEKPSWVSVSKILTAISKEDPEKIRHYMLAWVRNELLKNGKTAPRAYRIFQEFRDPWYECKEAGLVAACFAIVNNL